MTNRLMCKSNLLDFTAEIERKSKKTENNNYRQRGLIQRPPEARAGMRTSRPGAPTSGGTCYYIQIFFREMDEGEMKENRQY